MFRIRPKIYRIRIRILYLDFDFDAIFLPDINNSDTQN